MPYQILDVNYKEKPTGPTVYLYGVDAQGNHKTLEVKGYLPYFYVQAEEVPMWVFGPIEVVGVEKVERFLPIGYQTEKTDLWKVVLRKPMDTRLARVAVEKSPGFQAVFEADIQFKNRYLSDHGLGGMAWTEDGKVLAEDQGNAPLRYMALDLEVLPPKNGGMPRPEQDPIIICSLAFDPPYEGSDTKVLNSPDERSLVKQIDQVFKQYDPDILMGHNINGFDMDYLIKRAERHNVYLGWGRDGSRILNKMDGERNETKITGRVVVDTLPVTRKQFSLRNYQLRTVASLVGMEKGDVQAKEIRELWMKQDKRLFDYARQDALIVLRLIRDLRILNKYIELTKLSGQLLQDTVNGGQSGMIEALLLREFNKQGRVMAMKPARDEFAEEDDEVQYEGAKVLDPAIGLTEHVLTLDFTSLYPTITMAHNLCWSTIVTGPNSPKDEVIITPAGAKFVGPDTYQGIMPTILRRLFDERIRTKTAMKTASGTEKDVLDAKQYGIKILLNSFYGYSGYQRSRLFVKALAESVTAYGRDNLLDTKGYLESNYECKVVGGDTDSVFVAVGERKNYAEYKILGESMAKAVSARLPAPMKLSFENYLRRLLILAKKHYGGAVVGEDGKVKLKVRGLETVRRDWCPLTSNMLVDVLDMILKDGNVTGAVKRVQDSVDLVYAFSRRTEDGAVTKQDLEPFILTRRYRGEGAHKQVLAHDVVAQKCKARGTKEYVTGDRVEMVMVVGGHANLLKDAHISGENMKDRGEDPDYVVVNKMVLDEQYYLRKQILPPALRMLEPFGVTEAVLLKQKEFAPGKKKVASQKSLLDW